MENLIILLVTLTIFNSLATVSIFRHYMRKNNK